MPDERFTKAIREKNALTALISSEGWQIVDEIFNEKETFLMQDFLDPGQNVSDEKLRELRMAIVNIRMTRDLPKAIIADAEEIIHEFSKDQPEDEGGEEFNLTPTSCP